MRKGVKFFAGAVAVAMLGGLLQGYVRADAKYSANVEQAVSINSAISDSAIANALMTSFASGNIADAVNLQISANIPEGEKIGTEERPYTILEIVPFLGYAEMGYMVAGQEPIDLKQYRYDYEKLLNGTPNVRQRMEDIYGKGSTSAKSYIQFIHPYTYDGKNAQTVTEQLEFNGGLSSWDWAGEKNFAWYNPDPDFYNVKSIQSVSMEENYPAGYVNSNKKIWFNGKFVKQNGGEYKLEFSGNNLNSVKYVGSGGNYNYVREGLSKTFYTAVNTYDVNGNYCNDMKVHVENTWISNLDSFSACVPYYYAVAYELDNKDIFRQECLGLDAKNAEGFNIVVKTMTPEEVNANPSVIDSANMIYLNSQNHVANLMKTLYDFHRPEFDDFVKQYESILKNRETVGVVDGFDFFNHDLSWDCVMKIYNKVTSKNINNYATIIFGSVFANSINLANPYGKNYTKSISFQGMRDCSYGNNCYGANNNLAKLYLMLCSFPGDSFKTKYIDTGLVNNGFFQGLYDNYVALKNAGNQDAKNKSEADAIDACQYWGQYTFLDFGNATATSDMITLDGRNNESVLNGVLTFNEHTALTQSLLTGSFTNNHNQYTDELFDGTGKESMTYAEALKYLTNKGGSLNDQPGSGDGGEPTFTDNSADPYSGQFYNVVYDANEKANGSGEQNPLFGCSEVDADGYRTVEVKIDLSVDNDDFLNKSLIVVKADGSNVSYFSKDGDSSKGIGKYGDNFRCRFKIDDLNKQNKQTHNITVEIWYDYQGGDILSAASYKSKGVLYGENSILENKPDAIPITFVRRALFDLD